MSETRSAPTTAGEMLARGRAFLEAKGSGEARLEAELLVAHALGLDRLGLFMALDRPVGTGDIERARELFVRRAAAEPVAYITGVREFYGREFRVGPGVLVPRPETELLVDLGREEASTRDGGPLAVADLGTGSGCLAITLALELVGEAEACVTALDVSAEALDWARENARSLGAEVEFVEGDGVEALAQACPDGVDLLLSNPPYVDPAEGPALPADVRDYEPSLALFAPAQDPDHWARHLLEERSRLLRPGGLLLVELGLGQAQRLAPLAIAEGVGFHADQAGIQRVLAARV